MSIIRSNIARQLLAEGGAPRKGYRTGGDIEDDVAQMEASMGISGGPSPSEYAGMDQESQAEVDQARFDAGFRTPDYISMGVSDNATDRGFFRTAFDNLDAGLQNKRGDLIFNYLGRSTAPTLRGKLGLGKKGDINYVLDVLNNPDDRVYGLSNKEREIGEKLKDAGIVDEFDIRNMTQSKFDELFPGPQTGEGGDSEPIKKLRAPITEKKEEESKGEFDDILQFYGSRFAKGGSTGFEGSPEMGGRGTTETYGFDQSGPAGDSGDGGGPPTVMGGGDQPPSQKDLQGLRNQGFSDSKIAEMLGPLAAQYGLQQEQPEVLGVLGAGPGATFGQEVTKGLGLTGTTGITGTGFTVDNIADTIFDKGSLGGKARDALRSNKSNVQSLRDRFDIPEKADGGAIRQNYGLGSIVKKIGRTVKKVAKSPLGKAALFGAAAFGLPAIGSFGGTPGFLKSKFMKNLLLKEGKDRFTVGNLNPFSLLSIPTIASYFIAKKEEEEEELPTVSNTDPEFQKYLAFYGGPRRFAEAGGDIDKAPMKDIPRQEMASYGYNDAMSDTYDMFLQMKEKQLIPPGMDFQEFLQEVVPEMSKKEGVERTMAAGGGMMNPNDEMLNLGGNEMDLRGGGFVPLGEYEKKDDVPARLSKNEFVFTADAVKAAGGGSVDRGADIMYKTMKNLENKIA